MATASTGIAAGVNASPSTPARSADRFRLDGPSIPLDPRLHAFRSDIADIALAGLLFAPHYSRPDILTAATRTSVRGAPSLGASATSEILEGEHFAVLDVSGDWAWGYCRHDHYVGYVPATALGEVVIATHIVTAPAALLFAAPDIKAPLVRRLPMGSRFAGKAELAGGAFLAHPDGFVHSRHARTLAEHGHAPVEVAEALVGAPYLWGGRSGDGVDCSGLVQLAFGLCGTPVPRDSDQQVAAIGRGLSADEALVRGDLVFFPGHVGLMVDGERLIHANAHWMAVTVEPLADVVARGAEITGRRRP